MNHEYGKGACGGDNWIEVKEGCELPKDTVDVQIVIDGAVTAGYHVSAIKGGTAGWMEYQLKGSWDCKPSHWQPMASPPVSHENRVT